MLYVYNIYLYAHIYITYVCVYITGIYAICVSYILICTHIHNIYVFVYICSPLGEVDWLWCFYLLNFIEVLCLFYHLWERYVKFNYCVYFSITLCSVNFSFTFLKLYYIKIQMHDLCHIIGDILHTSMYNKYADFNLLYVLIELNSVFMMDIL